MRRTVSSLLAMLTMVLLTATAAQAAAPTLGAVSATDIQGVSALLVGSVNPQGEATSYYFEYSTAADFSAASKTPLTAAGSGGSDVAARAAISGLQPDTLYHYRLVAGNGSGPVSSPPAAFETTHGFGFLAGTAGFSAVVTADGGAPATVAGTHPYRLGLEVGLNQGGEWEGQPGVPFADGDLRDLRIALPPGLLLNPSALDKCKLTDFHVPRTSPFEANQSGESCPDRTQIGTIELKTSRGGGIARRFGLFNLEPPPGVAAQLGAAPFGSPLVFDVQIHANPDNSYSLSLGASNIPQSLDMYGISMAFWGIPWNPSHDGERGNCLNEAEPGFPWAKCSVGDPRQDAGSRPLAYITLPTSCEGPLAFSAGADAWQQPAQVSTSALNRDANGEPAPQSGCQSFSFGTTTAGFLTTTKASSPSGFNFRLSNDNSALTNPTAQLPPQTRTAVVKLPPEVTINPSLGAGLVGCTPSQYAGETAFSPPGAACPAGSKIGVFSVRTPLFEEGIEGTIYLAQPDDPATASAGAENPFDTLIAVYLVAKAPGRGVLVKLPGKLIPDLGSGQLTASFDGLPQLPYTELNLNFRSGQRAPLVTPASCGPAGTQIDLAPWSGPGAKHSVTDSQIVTGIDGGPCPTGAMPPFAPTAVAGGVNANVGSYTPYYVHLSRRDTEQEITSYSLVLPRGITAKLAGIPFCPDAAIEAARHRLGAVETAQPSCPAASEVGHTLTGYGVGSALTYATGHVYLAGPYHGSPLSLVTINSATVGPFDLGTIVIRSAFDIDEHTAQLRIDSSASDPIPHIIDGIPLHLREVRIYMDRFQFTHNPSSCEPSELISTLTGAGSLLGDSSDDSTATATEHFQLLNCLDLGFKPKLGLRLRGGSHRGAYPSLRATFAARGPQDSNLKRIEVVMPHSEFLAQNHIRAVCTRVQFAAEACPPGSIYGKAVAYTPLFDAPLRGDVYLRSSSKRLPELVADLHSGAIRIVVEGSIGPAKHGIRTLFENLPDAPLNRFTLTLFGGRRGLLTNSSNICNSPPLASVKALGQNNRGASFTTLLRGQCGGRHRHGGTSK